jgi:hypothetical protein
MLTESVSKRDRGEEELQAAGLERRAKLARAFKEPRIDSCSHHGQLTPSATEDRSTTRF